MSPGCGLIEQVENLLFNGARAHQIENVVVGEFYHLRQLRAHLRSLERQIAQVAMQA